MSKLEYRIKNAAVLKSTLARLFENFPAIRAQFTPEFKVTVDNLFTLVSAVKEDIEYYERNLEVEYDYTTALSVFAVDILYENESEIMEIMKSHLEEALKLNPEFGEYEPFSDPLRELFSRLELIQIIGRGNYDFKVDIMSNAYSMGGTAEDLSNVIIEARRQMAMQASEIQVRGTGTTLQGEMATRIWYNKLYATARLGKEYWYRKPMKEGGKKQRPRKPQKDLTARYKNLYHLYMQYRIEAFNDKVPIWYLLHFGNVEVFLNSNKGGYGKPKNAPTFFVQKMEDAIYNYLYSKASTKQNENIDRRTETNPEYQRHIELGQTIIRTIMDSLERVWKEEPLDFLQILVTKITEILPVTRKFVTDSKNLGTKSDKLKAQELVALERIILGQVPASGQLYLGSVEGHRVRTRAKEAEKRIREQLDNLKMTSRVQSVALQSALQADLDMNRWRVRYYNKLIRDEMKRK